VKAKKAGSGGPLWSVERRSRYWSRSPAHQLSTLHSEFSRALIERVRVDGHLAASAREGNGEHPDTFMSVSFTLLSQLVSPRLQLPSTFVGAVGPCE
jgi:hypothetical protein